MSRRLKGLLPLFVSFSVIFSAGPTAAVSTVIDLGAAKAHFAEAHSLCEDDGGELWGVSLCVPMMFIDPATRELVADRQDAAGDLQAVDGVFVGSWPADQNIANTTADWNGIVWTILQWPPPEKTADRAALMMHESFHNVQPRLGLPAGMPANGHLDTPTGRLWLQMEWRALRTALVTTGEEQQMALTDALTFRTHRHGLFEGADEEERRLELHEGLAEYTGLALSGRCPDGITMRLEQKLEEMEALPSFVRSFAYWSGPAYGLLLDFADETWRTRVDDSTDLGAMLAHAAGIELPEDVSRSAIQSMGRYDGSTLEARENERERQRQARLARYRELLVNGSVLVLPFQKMKIQFDPRNMVPLGKAGTVYPTLRVTDAWGILTVDGAALLASDWSNVRVSAPLRPTDRPLTGDGWVLDLNPGWKLGHGPREGDWVLSPGE